MTRSQCIDSEGKWVICPDCGGSGEDYGSMIGLRAKGGGCATCDGSGQVAAAGQEKP